MVRTHAHVNLTYEECLAHAVDLEEMARDALLPGRRLVLLDEAMIWRAKADRAWRLSLGPAPNDVLSV